MSQDPSDHEQEATEFERWKARANAARELLSDIDFEQVQRHDSGAVARLNATRSQLQRLADANAPDPDRTPPQIEQDAVRVARFLECLESAGHGDRIGRVLMTQDEKTALRPLDIVPHREGLPPFDLCVAPMEGGRNGAHAVFVTSGQVIRALAPVPLVEHAWQIERQQDFSSEVEMLDLIESWCTSD
jgi:hypothetical protein